MFILQRINDKILRFGMKGSLNSLYDFNSLYKLHGFVCSARYPIAFVLGGIATYNIWSQVNLRYSVLSSALEGAQAKEQGQEPEQVPEHVPEHVPVVVGGQTKASGLRGCLKYLSGIMDKKIPVPFLPPVTVRNATTAASAVLGWMGGPAKLAGQVLKYGIGCIQKNDDGFESDVDAIKKEMRSYEWNKYIVVNEFVTQSYFWLNFHHVTSLSLGLFIGCRSGQHTGIEAISKLCYFAVFGLIVDSAMSSVCGMINQKKLGQFILDAGSYRVSQDNTGNECTAGQIVARLCSTVAMVYFVEKGLVDVVHPVAMDVAQKSISLIAAAFTHNSGVEL